MAEFTPSSWTKYVPDGTHYYRVKLVLTGSGSGTTYAVTATVYHQRHTKVKLASSAWQCSLTGVSSAKYPASDVSSGTSDYKVFTKTYTYAKSTTAKTVSLTAKLKRLYNPDSGVTSTVTGSITIPALAKYSIAYDANGGWGAPSGTTTKIQGTAITLSTTVPTRTGYTFAGWSTTQNGAVAYSAGARYSADASATLWAVWKGIGYTVKFEPNGGSGTMATQAMTYGTAAALRKNAFTRQGYSFSHWAFVRTATTTWIYDDGETVLNLATTAGATVTLTAQWTAETVITGVSAINCDADGTEDDDGTCALITARYTYGNQQIDTPASAVCAIITAPDGAAVGDPTYSTGAVSWLVTGITPDTASSFAVTITGGGSSARSATVKLPAVSRVIDVKAGGKGLGLGAAAPNTGLSVGYEAAFKQGVSVAGASALDSGWTTGAGKPSYMDAAWTLGETPESNIYAPAIYGREAGGTNIGALHLAEAFADGRTSVALEASRALASGSTAYNTVRLLIDSAGARTVVLSEALPWLNALQQGIIETSTASQIVAAASGTTITAAHYKQWGRVACLRMRFTRTAAITVPAHGNITDIDIATVVSGKRPRMQSYGFSIGNGAAQAWYALGTDGVISLCACEGTGASRTIAKGTEFSFYCTYILN